MEVVEKKRPSPAISIPDWILNAASRLSFEDTFSALSKKNVRVMGSVLLLFFLLPNNERKKGSSTTRDESEAVKAFQSETNGDSKSLKLGTPRNFSRIGRRLKDRGRQGPAVGNQGFSQRSGTVVGSSRSSSAGERASST